MNVKQTLAVVLISAATAVGSVLGYEEMQRNNLFAATPAQTVTKALTSFASFNPTAESAPAVDFEKAATKAAPAVVHIKVMKKPKQVSGGNGRNNPMNDLFGDGFGDMFGGGQRSAPAPQQRGSGSGVSISADGFIVTNNHVIDGSDEILVTLNNKKDFKARLVGKDPSTDLAVIKIEANNLPFLTFANSDEVRLGQWVLAIGYPLNLETTVTSGIVSAKSRSLGINSRQSSTPIEAFIQTDAAVNPGNSGGALVNTDGNVIGINSAIASPTGSYAGYSYAIPSNLVQKVVTDIIAYGSTKRAYLGVMFGNDKMSEEERRKNNVAEGDGVFVMDVAQGSAAEDAGIKKGDFITKVNGVAVNTGTEMVGRIAALRPGDKVALSFVRNGAEKTSTVTLRGTSGTYASVKEQIVEQLGASFESLNSSQLAQLGLQSGVVVKSLGGGILSEQTRIREGFIITRINNTRVTSVEQLKQVLQNAGNSAIISGVYPNQPQREYQYAINELNSVE